MLIYASSKAKSLNPCNTFNIFVKPWISDLNTGITQILYIRIRRATSFPVKDGGLIYSHRDILKEWK